MTYKYQEIGDILRKRRIELGKDLSKIAEETRVLEKYLLAIEDGNIAEFFSPVYYGLFTRSYAKELGIDADELFRQEEEPEMVPKTAETLPVESLNIQEKPTPKKGGKFRIKAVIWSMALILGTVFIVILIILKGENPQDKLGASNNRLPLTAKITTDSIFPSDNAANSDSLLMVNGYDRAMHLRITVKETCWLMVVADGDTILSASLPPGTAQDLSAINRFFLSVGNPAGIELRLNDTILRPLSPLGKPVRDIEINQENKRAFYLLSGSSTVGKH
ncbi:MAG: DUF4115 domain-containing protein [candidate division Zixibacteria bacterium]|nr:DUF4115 domain-containing protein [candidate division Zixibacteria bacterium]